MSMTSSFFWLFWTLFLNILPAVVGKKVLILEENFDGDSLNDTVWTLNTGNGCDLGEGMCGWGNHEQQTYTLDNHLVADGLLTITAKREDVEVDERWYTSSRIRSKSPVAYLTGRIEARILLPAGLGLWAAFWMLPANDSRGLWAANGEIDILEAVNDMETIVGTIHYGGEYPDNLYAGCKQSSGIDFSDDFHTYAIEWHKEEMSWYVDEQLYCHRTKWSSTLDSLGSYRAPFDAEFELLVNLAVGGTLPGRFVDDTALPASMLVDYIRVYNITSEVAEAEPYLGVPACLPGFIEAEAYDIGGLGLGYGDSQPEGSFGTFRTDGTGLVETNGERTYVANLTEGDWTAYSVMTDNVVYDISLEVRTAEAASLHLLKGNDSNCSDPWPTTLTGDVAVGSLGSNSEWNTTFIYEIYIPAETHSLKLCVTGGVGIDVDRITFNLRDDTNIESVDLASDECGVFGEGRPYMFNKPWAIPGYIEAEYYDRGGPGVGYYKTKSILNSEYSTLRLPDGVDVIEADSNSAHGHYVGYWETGEWLAFTSRAEEGGWWDVAASIASGAENISIEFRILVNASNCSLPETDGFNGLGAEGVDLLDGPLTFSETGSWDAFELMMKIDVWVPQGDHRVMFCADSGSFNLNYLWFFTPNPTPVPTPSPTPVPTAAPQVPSKKPNTSWIYAAVFVPLGVLALSRLCWIVCRKERSRRQKPTTLNELDFASTSRGNGDKSPDSYSTPPIAGTSSDSTVFKGTPTSAIVLPTATASGGHLNMEEEHKQQQRDFVRILPHRFAFGAFSRGSRGNSFKQHQGPFHSHSHPSGGGIQVQGEPPSAPELESRFRPALHNGRHYFATVSGPLQPMVSPVESCFGVGAFDVTAGVPAKTPRAYADLDVQEAGSLWDRSSLNSPLRREIANSVSLGNHAKPKRDQFEDALLRALDTRLESSRAQHATSTSSPKPRLLRASSFSEGTSTSNHTPMLAAGKVWMCVCEFENTVGQASCLGCGRVAPSRRGSEGLVTSTPMRTRIPPHRMRSFIPPPTD